MKPDWKDAPLWAKWLAQDKDGSWCWFAEKPLCDELDEMWSNPGNSKYSEVVTKNDAWQSTIEARP